MKLAGHLRKMKARPGEVVGYELRLDETSTPLNSMIGERIRLSFNGKIACVNCGKSTKKSWNQGYCYPCTLKLAECDICIVKPELCHYAQGTCRDPKWGEEHCLKPHVVYLANTSGAKVGITRQSQVPTRWLDQGAFQALPMFKVSSRLDSGKIEILIGKHVADKTNWQRMLKGNPEPLDLVALKKEIWQKVGEELRPFILEDIKSDVLQFNYPVTVWPEKVKSLGLDKNPEIEDKLVGIKGQYLIFSTGVINLRNHTGYQISWEIV